MCCISICYNRILSVDVQTFDLTSDRCREYICCMYAWFGAHWHTICFFKFGNHVRIGNFLIAREVCRLRAHIAGTLYVILTTERVYAASRFAKFATEHCHVGHRHNALCTSRMLGNAQAVNNRSFVSCRIHSCSLDELIFVNVAYFCNIFRCVFFNDLCKLLKSFGTLFDKFLIYEAFFDHDMHHAVCKCNVCTRL